MATNFDLRDVTVDQASDGQLHTGDGVFPDTFYNCTMAALRDTARDYGYGAAYSAEQLRQLGAPGTHAGLGWEVSITAARSAFPALADIMTIVWPDDPASAIRQYGAQGYMVHGGFKCDRDANVPPIGPVTYSHALRARWADDRGTGFQNVEPHDDAVLSDAQVRDLYDQGGLLVFQRSLQPLPAFSSNSGGDGMVLLSTPAGRIDFVHVGTDGNVYHRWKNTKLDDLGSPAQNQSWGSPGRQLVKVAASYDDSGNVFDIVAAASDGSVWVKQVSVADGQVHNDWFQMGDAKVKV
jgi:hypothetical protein